MITVKIADLPIGINNRYQYIVSLAADYITDEAPLFTVSVNDDEIERERLESGEDFSSGYLESIVTYRKIAEILPSYDAFVFHGAVLNYEGTAYAFTAKSGTGKTTHTRLWLSEFGEKVHYLNGDKPIIRFINGMPYACGTPWRGKEGYGINERAPLCGIILLERAEKNSARKIESQMGILRLVTQIYLPKNPEAAKLTMRLADRVLDTVSFIELGCNMEPEAAHVARSALNTNKN